MNNWPQTHPDFSSSMSLCLCGSLPFLNELNYDMSPHLNEPRKISKPGFDVYVRPAYRCFRSETIDEIGEDRGSGS